ncbi:hypothetical protein OUZ56_014723 [Daphnia magna]|uniref:Uncharacterized protein n=1 Tax=Daphnia magna TaxID=35525 RepID=A0ABR0AKN0_9CRUS|nr:hypothetical protein OUZ56_014723 [Daphnia magna]
MAQHKRQVTAREASGVYWSHLGRSRPVHFIFCTKQKIIITGRFLMKAHHAIKIYAQHCRLSGFWNKVHVQICGKTWKRKGGGVVEKKVCEYVEEEDAIISCADYQRRNHWCIIIIGCLRQY